MRSPDEADLPAAPASMPSPPNQEAYRESDFDKFCRAVFIVGSIVLLMPFGLFIVTAIALSSSTHHSLLSPEQNQRATVMLQGEGFGEENSLRLRIEGGPADGTDVRLCKITEGDAKEASYQLRWISNHELHISDYFGRIQDWIVVRILSNGVAFDSRNEGLRP